MELRLSVFLSRASVASRRKADKLIQDGHVTINGQVVTHPGTRVNVGVDHVKVDGKIVAKLAPPVYLVLNKPAGYITTSDDPQGRATVFTLLTRVKPLVEPIGRLDYDSEGVLLFTNDGDLANLLMKPKSGVPKIYRVKVKGKPTQDALGLLRAGIQIDRIRLRPAKIRLLKKTDNYSWLRVTITEGKNRQVRRMFAKIGYPVVRLIREAYGPVETEDLKPGRFRYLRSNEIAQLRKAVL